MMYNALEQECMGLNPIENQFPKQIFTQSRTHLKKRNKQIRIVSYKNTSFQLKNNKPSEFLVSIETKYRRPSLFAAFLSANLLIHIGKIGPKWNAISRLAVQTDGTANNEGKLQYVFRPTWNMCSLFSVLYHMFDLWYRIFFISVSPLLFRDKKQGCQS